MKKMLVLAVVTSVAVLAGSLSAHAQGKVSEMVAKVSFEFKVGDKSFPAGSYKIVRRASNAPSLVISPEKGGEGATIPVITRLAQRSGDSGRTDGTLVFDTVGSDHVLSEVWMPGQDGFMLRTTAEEHQHEVVPVGR